MSRGSVVVVTGREHVVAAISAERGPGKLVRRDASRVVVDMGFLSMLLLLVVVLLLLVIIVDMPELVGKQ